MKNSFNKELDDFDENWDLDELKLIDKLVKDSLSQDFSVTIPKGFADLITEKVEKRKSVREALLKHLMMSIGLFVIVAFAVAFLFYFKTDQANVILNFGLKFKYPIAFGLLIFTAIQLADSFLLSRTKDKLEK